MSARVKIDEELKRQLVEQLVSGAKTVAEIAKEHKLHPYQVQAWVGQMTLGEGIGRKYQISRSGTKVSSTKRGSDGPTADKGIAQIVLDQITGEHIETDDPLHAIGEWYVRTVVLKNLPKIGGKEK